MNPAPFEIVILNDYAAPTGGSTAVAVASAVALAARGLRVTFFSCVGPVAPQLRNVPNLQVICLGQREIGKNSNRPQAFIDGWRNARAVRALRAVLAHKSPEKTLVHAHTWSQALSPFALAAAAGMGFRLIVTLHDFFTTCPNGQLFVHPRREICQRTPLSLACWRCNCDRRNYGHKLWRNARALLQDRILRVPAKASHYIGVSAFSLDLMRPRLPAGIPARVVCNPVDCPKSAPAPVAENRDFIFVGRFEIEKGVCLFARAAQATGVAATFVGDGSLRSTVQSLCPQARFTGWVPPPEMRRHLRTARALVFPSLWYETLGLVAVEAAAAGVPVIVSDGCAAADFIRHNVNGLHFVRDSVESLGAQMKALADDDRRAARLGAAGYEWYWRDPWTSGRHVSELLEVYAEVAGGPLVGASREGAYHECIDGV
ncbi:MAG TPA: glycosyltransferase family 4 protein [Opitutaceae bacterium]|nr:glycosyltransferase family 4 protein [Opitutaceae bacterium]